MRRTSARPSPCRRTPRATARLRISASSNTCLPTTIPETIPSRSLTNADTPGSFPVSRTASSDQLAASLAASRISATCPASSAPLNARITKPGFAVASLAMARWVLPENLRIRSPHVIRIEQQRIRKFPLPRPLFPQLSHPRRQSVRGEHHFFTTRGHFLPSARLVEQCRGQANPLQHFPGRMLLNPLDESFRRHHHLLLNQTPAPLFLALIQPTENLSTLRIKTRGHKARSVPHLPRHYFQSRNSHHFNSKQLRPSLYCSQPHSHSCE